MDSVSLPWFRFYHEFANDPKVQTMTEAMQRRLVMLFCLHACDALVTLGDDDIAFYLRVTNEELKETKKLFCSKRFIDSDWNIRNWEKRQRASDSSKQRTKLYRERKKATVVTECDGHSDGREEIRGDKKRVEEKEEALPREVDPSFSEWAEAKMAAHPNKKNYDYGIKSLFPFAENVSARPLFDENHALWCQTKKWLDKNGSFAPCMADYIRDHWWEHPPPGTQNGEDVMDLHERLMAEKRRKTG